MRVDIDHPASFKEGVRVLLLMLRAKDGGSAKTDRKAVKKIVTQSPQEFDEALQELRGRWKETERIYASINPRNIGKAIRLFKYRQLDADYFASKDHQSFYLDLNNRWYSCLMDGKSSDSSLFLFDVDNDVPKGVHPTITAKVSEWEVLDDYPTRNGRHVITTPFNPAVLERFNPKDGLATLKCLQRDALMLWSY